MVRLKNRWFIVRVDTVNDNLFGRDHNKPAAPMPPLLLLLAKRDLFLLISNAFTEHFGIVHAGALRESKVQLCDNQSRLVLVKTPRRIAAQMRAVLAWMTRLPTTADNMIPVVWTVLGEHASLRTAKRSMIIKLRGAYRGLLFVKQEEKKKGEEPTTTTTTTTRDAATMVKVGQSLQTILQELHAIDF